MEGRKRRRRRSDESNKVQVPSFMVCAHSKSLRDALRRKRRRSIHAIKITAHKATYHLKLANLPGYTPGVTSSI